MTTAEVFGLSVPVATSDAAQPDAADVGTLVRLYSSVLFRVAHSILRSRSDAEDVVQEVFVRVLEHQAKLPDVREMRVYLVRIAWNLALDRRRRARPEQMDAAFLDALIGREQPADAAVDQARRLRRVLEEIDRLPRRERHTLLLAGVEELQTAEVARLIGRSESATRALLFRARARLRERLEEGGNR